MAKMSVNDLKKQLVMGGYTPRTDDELRSEAEKQYQTQYNQQRLNAQQNYETKDNAYKQQLASLADSLAVGQNALQKDTADSIASANRYMITRGMQRSSYGMANQASIQNKGNESLAALMKQYQTNANGIESDRTLLARQLADTLSGYDIDYLNDIQKYIDQQKQIDYDRKVAADQYQNQLQTQLFEYSRKYDGGGGGGGGSRKSSGGSTTPSATNPSSNLFDQLDKPSKPSGSFIVGAANSAKANTSYQLSANKKTTTSKK